MNAAHGRPRLLYTSGNILISSSLLSVCGFPFPSHCCRTLPGVLHPAVFFIVLGLRLNEKRCVYIWNFQEYICFSFDNVSQEPLSLSRLLKHWLNSYTSYKNENKKGKSVKFY